jgi:uncharacterized protein YecE (DUF72 family)
MRICAGTSGFSYAAWKGPFYPPRVKAAEMLSAYAQRLPTVEINATFYRMPQAKTLAAWRAQVPASFLFALKGSRRITHSKRLAGAAEEVAYFYRVAAELEGTLGPVLWQLPPGAKRDVAVLRDFLEQLPSGGRSAFEFRHASWFSEEVLRTLADAGAALCIADDEDRATPVVATAPFGYLRLRRPDYDGVALARWADSIRAQPWEDAFVFFKHEEEAKGPAYALRFGSFLAAEEGAQPSP